MMENKDEKMLKHARNKKILKIAGITVLALGVCCTVGFRKEMATYIKNESVPVFNEAGEEMKPGISAIAGAVKDAGKTVVCPYCGSANGADDNFCSKCGKPLVFTCPRCNAKVSADSAFCPKCGEKL